MRCQRQMKHGERVAAVKILAALMPLQNFGNRNRESAFPDGAVEAKMDATAA